MTPAQEAKEFAAAHGFVISQCDRRYEIVHVAHDEAINEVANVGGYPAALNAMKLWVTENVPQGWASVDTSVDEIIVPDAGAPTLEVAIDNAAQAVNSTVANKVFPNVQQYGRAQRPLHLRGACQGVWTLDDGEFYKPNPGYPWRVWQKAHDGVWRALIPFATRADAVAYCRRLANIRSLHNLAREIRYEV